MTPNDAGDGDSGANNLQNFPLLTSASPQGGGTQVTGTLNSTPSRTFRVELFSNDTCDPSGNGEGQTFLGDATATTDGAGNASFTAAVGSVLPGGFITATATDSSTNDTSEFSACRAPSLRGEGWRVTRRAVRFAPWLGGGA